MRYRKPPEMRQRSALVSVMAIVLPLSIFAVSPKRGSVDPCRCSDAKATDRYRYYEKHTTDFLKHPEAGERITCRDIIAWQKRYKKNVKSITRHARSAPRMNGTPEDSLYTLTGVMYYVRHESKPDGDCDLHIEIGTDDPAEMRAIVEVTNDDCVSQKRIIDHIVSKGERLGHEFSAGLPCVVQGLGFYDGHQRVFEHGRAGKTNVSSWELHPVKSIEFK
jgi:hypothetical protein